MEGTHTSSGGGNNFFKAYSLEITILVAALLVSSTMFVSFGSLAKSNDALVSQLRGGLAAGPTGGSPTAGQQAQPQAPSVPPVGSAIQVNTAGKAVRGDANAPVTLIEFSDFQCPFCKRASPTVNQVLTDYQGRVKLVFMHYPLSFHQNAQKSAEAFECAKDQSKEWEYHDKLFELGQADGAGLEVPDLKQYAVTLGLDATRFNSCLDGGEKAAAVRADVAQLDAKSQEFAAWGIDGIGTPTFLVNGKPLVGAQPFAAFKAAIDAELAG